jgi:hypothetical protein
MSKFINTFLLIVAVVFFYQGCSDGGPSIPTNNNNTGNQAPNQPKNPNPPDSSENVDTTSIVVLSWQCTDPDEGDTLKYDVYIGNSNPPPGIPIAENLPNPSYGLGIVYSGTTYFWKVIAKDNHGAIRSSNVWRFKTRIY